MHKEGQPINEISFFGSTQVQSVKSVSELKRGELYIYHYISIDGGGKAIEETFSMKFLRVNEHGDGFFVEQNGREVYLHVLSLSILGLAPTANGEWLRKGWLEDPTKKA